MLSIKKNYIPDTKNDNNAYSFSNPDISGSLTGRLTLFFKGIRGISIEQLYNNLLLSYKENIIDTYLLAFNIRDCRGGKGERQLGVQCFIWLFINDPDNFMKIVHLIPEYGRWDDLLYFFPGVLNLSNLELIQQNYYSNINIDRLIKLINLQKKIVYMFGRQLIEDKDKMYKGEICSLAAKWAPTENSTRDKKYNVYKILANSMKITPKSLRTIYISPLRSYLNIVECLMCSKMWNSIDYNKVPSCAMKNLKSTFEKHDRTRYNDWKSKLKLNKSKVCAKQLFPYELVREMRIKGYADEVCKAQWKVIEDECMSKHNLDNDMAIIDTSASMYCNKFIPYDVAISLGLLISKCNKKSNSVITFSSSPNIVTIEDEDIFNRMSAISNIKWESNTNLRKTFELILKKHRDDLLPIPKRIWLISDMQFDAIEGEKRTNFQEIDSMYNIYGYKRPDIIFWNVNGSISDFPVTVDDNGTTIISGFSQSIMSSILVDNHISPLSILRKTLDSDRLEIIKELF